MCVNTSVTELNLNMIGIREASAESLSRMLRDNQHLRILNLSGNDFGDAGAKLLSEGLVDNTELEVLHLAASGIADVGAEALAHALRFNESLLELHLNENPISDEGCVTLVSALECNTTIEVLSIRDSLSLMQCQIDTLIETRDDRSRLSAPFGNSFGHENLLCKVLRCAVRVRDSGASTMKAQIQQKYARARLLAMAVDYSKELVVKEVSDIHSALLEYKKIQGELDSDRIKAVGKELQAAEDDDPESGPRGTNEWKDRIARRDHVLARLKASLAACDHVMLPEHTSVEVNDAAFSSSSGDRERTDVAATEGDTTDGSRSGGISPAIPDPAGNVSSVGSVQRALDEEHSPYRRAKIICRAVLSPSVESSQLLDLLSVNAGTSSAHPCTASASASRTTLPSSPPSVRAPRSLTLSNTKTPTASEENAASAVKDIAAEEASSGANADDQTADTNVRADNSAQAEGPESCPTVAGVSTRSRAKKRKRREARSKKFVDELPKRKRRKRSEKTDVAIPSSKSNNSTASRGTPPSPLGAGLSSPVPESTPCTEPAAQVNGRASERIPTGSAVPSDAPSTRSAADEVTSSLLSRWNELEWNVESWLLSKGDMDEDGGDLQIERLCEGLRGDFEDVLMALQRCRDSNAQIDSDSVRRPPSKHCDPSIGTLWSSSPGDSPEEPEAVGKRLTENIERRLMRGVRTLSGIAERRERQKSMCAEATRMLQQLEKISLVLSSCVRERLTSCKRGESTVEEAHHLLERLAQQPKPLVAAVQDRRKNIRTLKMRIAMLSHMVEAAKMAADMSTEMGGDATAASSMDISQQPTDAQLRKWLEERRLDSEKLQNEKNELDRECAALAAAAGGLYPEVAMECVEEGLGEVVALAGLLSLERTLDHYSETVELASTERGARNSVYAARFNGTACVLKRFVVNDVKHRRRFMREALRLARLEHPHVVQVQCVFFSPNQKYAYTHMPRYRYGDLLQWVRSCRPSDAARQRALRGALLALEHVHRHEVVHCDVKPQNIFVDGESERGSAPEEIVARLGDFDVSKEARERTVSCATTQLAFSAQYVAPELVFGSGPAEATFKTDVYAFGLTVHDVFFPPVVDEEGSEQLQRPSCLQVARGHRQINLPANVDRDLLEVLSSMLAREPRNRPNCSQLLQHRFFARPARPPPGAHHCGGWGDSRICGVQMACIRDVPEHGDSISAQERQSVREEDGGNVLRAGQGVQCCAEHNSHWVCDDDLAAYVTSWCAPENLATQARNGGRLRCFAHRCDHFYEDHDLALHLRPDLFRTYMGMKERHVEQRVVGEQRCEMDRRLAELEARMAREGTVGRHRQRIEEDLLTLHCPRCKAAFLDFTGCMALVCSACPCGFCAWCLTDCGDDAHRHVSKCPFRLVDGYSCFLVVTPNNMVYFLCLSSFPRQ
eukprot:TRINITY_DN1947_c1_g1_i2.p1 TRINITY_DN1947_c1_g1~~TRINITY_DN1947_c1_g1_i2.p1  ORF type:complete len:1659 (-),score=227.61 TRINITY_DN1947_c1_g1_i2:219-4466(-)